jgi:uncharacterized membrane protein YhaH (DUF805 family)
MFKNPFSFNGRIRRTEFGISFIIYFICYFIILASTGTGSSPSFLFLGVIPLVWFVWAQGAKRCHDVGNSGWWIVIPFYVFWLLFQDGTTGPNEYGEDPKGRIYEYDTHETPFNANQAPDNSISETNHHN